jgi:hypothetical protein
LIVSPRLLQIVSLYVGISVEKKKEEEDVSYIVINNIDFDIPKSYKKYYLDCLDVNQIYFFGKI